MSSLLFTSFKSLSLRKVLRMCWKASLCDVISGNSFLVVWLPRVYFCLAGGSVKPEISDPAIFSGYDEEASSLMLNSVILRLELPALMERMMFGFDMLKLLCLSLQAGSRADNLMPAKQAFPSVTGRS